MDLIERYLTAVAALLPRSGRADIIAELRDVLMNRREDKAAELGRPLTRDEDAVLLKAFGNPIEVAGRYGRQQYLVGPELYPLYVVALKVLIAIIVAAAVITGVVHVAVGDHEVGPAVLAGLAVLRDGVVNAVGVLTIIAAILQYQNIQLKFLDSWNPKDLPKPLKRGRRQTWFDHVASIVVQTVFILWWTGAIHLWQSFIPLQPGRELVLAPAPIWTVLYWPILGLSFAIIVVDVLKLMGGAWRRVAYGVDIPVQVATIVVAALAVRAGEWIVVSGSGLPATAIAGIELGVRIGFQILLVSIVVGSAWTILYDGWRLYRDGGAGEAAPSAPR